MAERSTISQTVAIGPEITPGTPVAATKRLGSIGFAMGIQTESQNRRPIGQKYNALVTVGQEWTEGEIEGAPVYTELPYIFASLLSKPTVTPILDGATPTGATRWVFETSTFGADDPQTFTVEQGSAARAHRVSNGIITDFSLTANREELEIEGTLLARALEDGITLTANPTQLPQIPVLPSQVSIYLDDEHTDLGTTKQLRTLGSEVNIESRYAPLWVIDAAQNSFVNTLEGEAEVEFVLTQMADAQAMSNLVAMRQGASRFLRWEAVGPTIYTPGTGDPIRHRVTVDMAGQVSEAGEFDDEDGVYAIEWTFGGVHDPAWGRAMRVEIVTTTTAL